MTKRIASRARNVGSVAAALAAMAITALPQSTPAYRPRQQLTGEIRLWGSPSMLRLMTLWEEGFRRYEPNIVFSNQLKSTATAQFGLFESVADLAVSARHLYPYEFYGVYRRSLLYPVEITVATGAPAAVGKSTALAIVVNKANPLAHVTMAQLDGIFGAERLGGWEGTSWHSDYARGPEKNIRTWGQLGLTGEWADKPITPYGLNLRYHQSEEISDRLLQGSDKWNERLRIYANFVAPDGKLGRGLNDDLKNDKYGIAYVAAPVKKQLPPELKVLPLAKKAGDPYVEYTMDNLQNRTYPLYDEVFAYADQPAGQPLDPKVKEYLRFIVSRQGQEEVERDGKYLPLTAEVAQAQLAKLQ